LEVERGDRLLPIGGIKHRALLAVLLLHVNRVVSRDDLIEAIWGERAPQTAQTALQVYISALRKTLGADSIITRAPGYALQADPESVDLHCFEVLVRAGKDALAAGDAGAAADRLTSALDLWRGVPLADLDSAPFVEAERRRLDELRLGAIEQRIDADLALERSADLISELQTLVREHPLRERLREQLMLSLYRSGRQAEALEVYQRGRKLLADELGLEPGEALRELERAILVHDPSLGPVTPAVADRPRSAGGRADKPGAPGAAAARARKVRPRTMALGALALAGAAIGIAMVLSGNGPAPVHVVPNSVAIVDPKTNRLVGDVAVGKRPVAVAVDEAGVWIANGDDGTVSRIDPKTRKVEKTIGIGTDVHDLAIGFGSVWLADGISGTVTRIDPSLNRVTATLRVGPGVEQPVFWIATGSEVVWATRGNTLLRIDPSTNHVMERIPIPAPAGLTAVGARAWVVTADQRLLSTVPHANATRVSPPLGHAVLAPAFGAGALWLISYVGRGEIWRIDPESPGVSSSRKLVYPATTTKARARAYPLDLAVRDGAAWAVDVNGTVLRLNSKTGRVVARIPTGQPTIRSAVAVGSDVVWITLQEPS
jgi:YVTN family beta-propeller protein